MADSTRDVERQVFILDEAEEELDWGDEDEDALSAPDLLVREEQERAHQKAESVKLKDRSERSLLENVVSRWEQRLSETAADETQNPTISHRKHHPLAHSTPSPSPSRASLPPEPPAPVLHLGNAGTSHPALQSLPVPPSSPHPSPAAPEARSTSLALPAYPPSTESPGDIALAAPKAKAPAPTPSAHTQSSEGSGEVSLAAPEAKSSPVSATLSYPPPLHAPSPEGSRDVFLPAPQVKLTVPAPQAQSPSVQSPSPGTDGDLSLPSPESQLLFLAPAPSMEGSGTVSRAAQDNSFLMDVESPQHEDPLSENGEGDIPMANQTSGKVKVVIDDHEDSADEFESEHNISDMTNEQHELAKWIKEHNIPTLGPFPYHVYHVRCKRGSERAIVERINEDIACGTVSSNLIHAAFISQFPGGFYLQARSMLPRNVPLALYLNLFPNLIHPRGKKFSLREEWDQLRLGMPLHTLVDDLSGTEDSKRMFYGNNFRPGTWVVPTKGLYRGDTGNDLFSYTPPLILGETLKLNGKLLVPYLRNSRVSNSKLGAFNDVKMQWPYPNADVLPSRLPPSLSWSFTSGETVIYVPDGTELQDVVKGDEGVIQRDGSLECEVLFSRSQVIVSVLKCHLRKTWRLAQVVELSPHAPEVMLRKREQLGYSGVSTLHEDHFMLAGQTRIITKVRLDEVDRWLNLQLSNVGATIALKPSLSGIQRDGNLDQKADLAEIADSFISHEVNHFDLRRGEYRAQNRSTAMTSMLTSIDQMSSFLNSTIPSTLFGYVATALFLVQSIPDKFLGCMWKSNQSQGNEKDILAEYTMSNNGGFIHESTFTKKISSYFNFSKGYIPRHREDELPVTNLSTDPTNADGSRTPKSHCTAIDYSVPAVKTVPVRFRRVLEVSREVIEDDRAPASSYGSVNVQSDE
ncbi:hypothetical protein DFJ43DRAFT_1042010 [Lentinula guzmanii]|uniref:Uncharacterized protein n=1 Tax=Lentinula guzmanii TaxID=2804957 RepID=A0AA38J6C9_9AGAR|nr:hypothetical protein DFJ43DRAFT_1042010 [Lentinula guzmanii]